MKHAISKVYIALFLLLCLLPSLGILVFGESGAAAARMKPILLPHWARFFSIDALLQY